jgi:hypothetical protein
MDDIIHSILGCHPLLYNEFKGWGPSCNIFLSKTMSQHPTFFVIVFQWFLFERKRVFD